MNRIDALLFPFISITGSTLIFCLSVVIAIIFNLSDSPILKCQSRFKDREDIVTKLDLKNLPPCKFDEAWLHPLDGSTTVTFKYDKTDSAAMHRYTEELKEKRPMQCYSTEYALYYGTIGIDGKESIYVNMEFAKDGIYINYTDVCLAPDVSMYIKDTFGENFPKSKMITYEDDFCFCDGYSWKAVYTFDKPLSRKTTDLLKRACKNKKGWNINTQNKFKAQRIERKAKA